MKRARASPATLAAKRIKPNPEISAVTTDSKKWRGGSRQRVTWSSQGAVPMVDVRLYKDNRLIGILSYSVANTNARTITVPEGLTPGKYKLSVHSSSDSSVFAESASPVKIDIGAQTPQISAVAVQQHFVATSAVPFHTGSRQRVTWSSQGVVPVVDVRLYKYGKTPYYTDNRLIDILCHSVANTNARTIKVPEGLTPGKYKLSVHSSSDSSVFAESPAFMIDDEHRERCVRYALLLLGLPPKCSLPYAIVRQIAVAAATR